MARFEPTWTCLLACFENAVPSRDLHHISKSGNTDMDSNALKAFLTIVDQGSFSEAAEILHLTQPAISKRLAALENQLGTSLIDRSHRQIRLTDAGSRLLPHARRILDEIHNARVALSPDSGQVQGENPMPPTSRCVNGMQSWHS